MDYTFNKKISDLNLLILSYDKVIVAFSGGVDSAFLLWYCKNNTNSKVIAFTFNNNFINKRDVEFAKLFCKKINVEHFIYDSDEITDSEILKNPVNRCYFCKKEIFSTIKRLSKEKFGINTIFDGTNFDDEFDYRPGLKALDELGIISPLKIAKITKKEIRTFLGKNGFSDIASKPSNSCLATRVPYNIEITKEILLKIEKSENFLHDLGFKEFRVRYHNDIARLEISKDEYIILFDSLIRDKIVEKFKSFGFRYVTLDLLTFKSGSMNEVING